jgi:hypothetical protein
MKVLFISKSGVISTASTSLAVERRLDILRSHGSATESGRPDLWLG